MYRHIDDFEIQFCRNEHSGINIIGIRTGCRNQGDVIAAPAQAALPTLFPGFFGCGMRAWQTGWTVADKCNSFQLLQHFCFAL
jgi:hypothetical protein